MAKLLACQWCGTRLDQSGPGRPKRFCSHAHRSRHFEWSRVCSTKVSLVGLASRDGYRCGICSGTVDLQAQGPLGPSIDHIVPASKGGAHTLENLQLAHVACNTLKSDRLGFTCDAAGSGVPPLTLF
jgi:5-methylcytosine-specific restriction endonuclease McrA